LWASSPGTSRDRTRPARAIPAAVSAHLRTDDFIVATYRDLHDCVAKGVPLDEMLAEMCGRVTGTSKGKGGPCTFLTRAPVSW
jgi:TPP-dependent pyruvate/acetoin dehydrogenase alpha subunit